jgi:hypothetical protein
VAAPRKRSKEQNAAAYARRDARARALGFASYYDLRVRRRNLGAPRPSGEALRRARGHRGGRDLVRAARDSDLINAGITDRDSKGRYRRIDLSLIAANDGSETEFTLTGRQLTKAYLLKLVEDLEAKGVIFNHAYDLRKIAAEASE